MLSAQGDRTGGCFGGLFSSYMVPPEIRSTLRKDTLYWRGEDGPGMVKNERKKNKPTQGSII